MKKLYLIAGPMGVGKTTVANIIGETIKDSLFLDGDNFWTYKPNGITEEDKKAVLNNIVVGLNTYLDSSKYQTIIFTWIMHQQFIIDSIVNRLNLKDTKLYVITLTCDEKTLINRIRKDINDGKRSEDVIERSLSRLKDSKNTKTLHIDTTSLTADEVAEKILKLN